MKKLLAAASVLLALLLVGEPYVEVALAQKGGRSFSSGGGGRSFSSSGKGFSSGNKGFSSSNKTFSSGSSRPSTPSTTPKYSSGSKPSTPGFSWPSSPPSPAGKPTVTSQPSTTPSVAPRPTPPPRFDTLASEAQRKAESRKLYERANAPAPSYTPRNAPPNTKPIPIDDKDRTIRQLREDLNYERWVNRQNRIETFYTPRYLTPPQGYTVVYYRDPYSDFFWWWLLAQSLETRAYWAYHHRDVMDETRYRDLLAKDAELKARVEQLEKELAAKNVARDPTWTPKEMENQGRDLMYRDEVVDAVYNPQPKVQPAPPRPTPPVQEDAAAWAGWFIFLLILVLVAFVIWLVFFKRWGGT